MAEGRMLKKKISFSETVNELSFEEMLIYTWSIPHSDDIGLIPASPKKLRATIAPMWDMASETFGNHVESIRKAGLFKLYEYGNQRFYYIVGHRYEQSLKKSDRKPTSYIPEILNWGQVEDIWNELDSNCLPSGSTTELKGTELKGEEENTVATLTEGICKGIAEKYSVSLKAVRGARDALMLHCKKNAKVFADYPAALEDWVRQDIENKKIAKLPPSSPIPVYPDPTPEEQINISRTRQEIRKKLRS